MNEFPYKVNVIDFIAEDYREFLSELKFKIDYDIQTILKPEDEDVDLMIVYAEFIYFKNEEDLLAFKLVTGIY